MENSEHKTAEQIEQEAVKFASKAYNDDSSYMEAAKYPACIRGYIAGWKACELYSAQQVAEARNKVIDAAIVKVYIERNWDLDDWIEVKEILNSLKV